MWVPQIVCKRLFIVKLTHIMTKQTQPMSMAPGKVPAGARNDAICIDGKTHFWNDEFTACGICCGVCFFPLGLIYCFLMRERVSFPMAMFREDLHSNEIVDTDLPEVQPGSGMNE